MQIEDKTKLYPYIVSIERSDSERDRADKVLEQLKRMSRLIVVEDAVAVLSNTFVLRSSAGAVALEQAIGAIVGDTPFFVCRADFPEDMGGQLPDRTWEEMTKTA